MLSIVDAFDAMTSERPYKRAIAPEEALAEIRRCAGSQFDPALAEVFIGLVGGAYTAECVNVAADLLEQEYYE